MPYIKPEARTPETFDNPKTAGQLNWVISVICWDYFHKNGENYQAVNDVLGVLTAAPHEFYRRIVTPLEDLKIAVNGDL